MNMRLISLLLALSLGTLAGSGCSSKDTNDEEDHFQFQPVSPDDRGFVDFVGFVVYNPAEGGFYGLKAGEQKYDPLQLPKSYQVDGMQVRVRARLRDWVSGRNWGRMVHVVSIEPCCDPAEDEDD